MGGGPFDSISLTVLNIPEFFCPSIESLRAEKALRGIWVPLFFRWRNSVQERLCHLPEATQFSDSASRTPRCKMLSDLCALLEHRFRLSRTDSYVQPCLLLTVTLPILPFIALGSTLKCNCKCSTQPNVHSPGLVMRLLSGGIGEQQDDSTTEMRNVGQWDFLMASVTQGIWPLVCGYVGTFCIWEAQNARISPKHWLKFWLFGRIEANYLRNVFFSFSNLYIWCSCPLFSSCTFCCL